MNTFRNNPHIFLLLILLVHLVLPITIFGHIGLIPHDTLEGSANDFIISKIYNFKFEYLDYLLGGNHKWFFWETVFYPINIFHLFLEIKTWYFFIYILKILVAYITFYLLLKKLLFTKFESSLGAILYVTVLSALYQSLFDLAFMPYILYSILKDKNLSIKNYIIIFFFGLNGGLVHNFFAISLIPLISFFIFKKNNFRLQFKIFSIYILALFLTDIHLFHVFFSDIPFHRVDMISKRPLLDLFKESLVIPFFEFHLTGYHKVYRIFLIIVFFVGIVLNFTQKNKIGIYLILAVIFTIILRTFVGSEYFYIIFKGPLTALQGLNFMRVDRIIPILMCLMTMYSLNRISTSKGKKIYIFIILISIFFQQISITAKKFHASIRANLKEDVFIELKKNKKETKIFSIISIILDKNNYKNKRFNLGNDKYSWDNYFHYDSYNIIKDIVKEKRVMSVGIDPLVAVLNDIKVIDGYHNLYYADYKYKFRKIISEEIQNNEFLKGYYDGWGNRVYAFYSDKNNLRLNFLEAKKIGASYIISGFKIKNEKLKLIKRIPSNKIYIHSTSWQCYLCLKSDAFYIYKILNN